MQFFWRGPGGFVRGRVLATTASSLLVLGGLAACRGNEGPQDAGSATTASMISFEFSGDAAEIDGAAVPAQVIAEALAVFEAAPEVLKVAFGESSLNQAGSDQPNPAIVANVLTTEIAVRVIAAEVTRRGLPVTDNAKALADTQMQAYFGTALESQGAYRQLLAERYALYVTLDQGLQVGPPTEAALQAEYDKDPAAYDRACAHHVLVASEEEANTLLARIKGGLDLSEVAKANSADKASAALGGDLGCQGRGMYVEAFEQAVWKGEVGVVQGPIKTEFGYHLIRVDRRGSRSFEEARTDVGEALAPQPFAALGAWLGTTLAQAAVTVDPRFGTWDRTTGQVNPLGVAVGKGLSINPGQAPTSAGS